MSRAPALNNGMITSPITQSGRVVINARKDTYSIDKRMREITTHDEDNKIGWGASDGIADENFSVLPHEIAVYDCVRMYESRLAREESIPVITSANGLTANNWQINDDAEGVAFMGVAMSRALHDSRNAARNEEDCTVQVGGLCTILNNGGEDIKAGEWVAYSVEVKKQHASYRRACALRYCVPYTRKRRLEKNAAPCCDVCCCPGL